MKLKSYVMISFILLSGCASTPPQTLDEKLVGKSLPERKEILRLACLNEAEYTTDLHKSKSWPHLRPNRKIYLSDTQETKDFKKLCRKMDAASGNDKNLAQECKETIKNHSKENNAQKADHFNRMTKICEEMTGQKIKIGK